MDLAANIFLGREPNKNGIIQDNEIKKEATKYSATGRTRPANRYDLQELFPSGNNSSLKLPKLFPVMWQSTIMDEPTSAVYPKKETETLFEVVKDLKNQGISVIYISHRLGEVIQLSDRVTIFRDGANAGDLAKEEINHENMVRLMVGRDLSEFYNRQIHQPGRTVLQAGNNLTCLFYHTCLF